MKTLIKPWQELNSWVKSMFGRFEGFWLENTELRQEHYYDKLPENFFEKFLNTENLDNDVLITVTGIKHYFGKKPFDIGTKVFLQKETKNEYDKFAVAVLFDGIKKGGYVANSDYTVKNGTFFAREIYGGIENLTSAKVLWADEDFAICSIDKMSQYDLLCGWGTCFFEDGKFDEAIGIFKFLMKYRECAAIYKRLSLCYIKKSDFRNALENINKAIGMDGDSIKNLIIRSAIFKELKEYKKALSDADTILEIDKDNIFAKKIKEELSREL